jgi:hypothetical protein
MPQRLLKSTRLRHDVCCRRSTVPSPRNGAQCRRTIESRTMRRRSGARGKSLERRSPWRRGGRRRRHRRLRSDPPQEVDETDVEAVVAGPGADIAGRIDARSVSVSDEPLTHSDGESTTLARRSSDDSCADSPVFWLRPTSRRPVRGGSAHLRPVTAASSAVPALQRIAGGRTGQPAPLAGTRIHPVITNVLRAWPKALPPELCLVKGLGDGLTIKARSTMGDACTRARSPCQELPDHGRVLGRDHWINDS